VPAVLGEPLFPTDRICPVWDVDHAEGLAIAPDGTVWCGGEKGQVYRGRLDGDPEEVARLPGRTLGFCLDGEGNAYCADLTGRGLYRITPDGRVDLVSSGTHERPAHSPNHPAFLPSGRLLFTDSGEWGADDGRIYAVDPDATTTIVDVSASRFPNGLALSADGKTLAVVESRLPGVSVLDLGRDGSLSGWRVLVRTPGMVPDGVAYDALGRLLVSFWAPDVICRLDDDSRLQLLAHDELRFVLNQPTNIAFVPGTATLVAANIADRFLSVIEYETPGAELPRPALPWAAPSARP